jgi:hypothetical protein
MTIFRKNVSCVSQVVSALEERISNSHVLMVTSLLVLQSTADLALQATIVLTLDLFQMAVFTHHPLRSLAHSVSTHLVVNTTAPLVTRTTLATCQVSQTNAQSSSTQTSVTPTAASSPLDLVTATKEAQQTL